MTVAPTPLQSRPTPNRALIVILAILVVLLATVLVVQLDVFDGSSSSSVQGSGVAASEIRDVPPFAGVELRGSNNVIIRAGRNSRSACTRTTTCSSV